MSRILAYMRMRRELERTGTTTHPSAEGHRRPQAVDLWVFRSFDIRWGRKAWIIDLYLLLCT